MANSLRTDVLNRISQDNWLSDSRKRYLERLATLTAGSKIRIMFKDIPTASCAWRESGYHQINMRSQELELDDIPSKFAQMDDQLIHTLTQEGFLWHELGHVLMSDYDAWEHWSTKDSALKKQKMFKQFLNCTEDVVIEAWLREKFDCGKILDFKNEMKLYGISPGPDPGVEESYYDHMIGHSDFSFVLNLIESVGRFDGEFLSYANSEKSDLMDTFEGPVREMISDAIREPNCYSRYKLIHDVFDKLWNMFNRENPDGGKMFSPENQSGGDAEMSVQMIPQPKSQDEDEDDDGDGDGEDSGNNPEEQEGKGSGGNTTNREARSLEELLDGRDPEQLKVVM